ALARNRSQVNAMFPNLDGPVIWIATNSVGALAFLTLTIFVVIHGRHLQFVYWLLVASTLTFVWFALLAAEPLISLSAPVLDVIESLRRAAWRLLAAGIIGPARSPAAGVALYTAVAAIPAILLGYLTRRASNSLIFGSATAGHSIALVYGTL